MRRIPVAEIEDGMMLATEVFDERGGLLLNPGDRLRKSYVYKLEGWGVKEVNIVDDDEDAAEETPAPAAEAVALPREMEERILKKISHRFERVKEDPLMRNIKRLSQKHILIRASKRYNPQ